MNQIHSCQLETLKQFNLWIRQQLELAEAQIPTLNKQIDQLARTGLLERESILGHVIQS
jgi:hypothetical protein